ncbi:hypothetical protein IM043_gp286 [Bacillus phage SPG24]|nr:hypothetical protein IM043_gp286 [Bacillus phage SPG24]
MYHRITIDLTWIVTEPRYFLDLTEHSNKLS